MKAPSWPMREVAFSTLLLLASCTNDASGPASDAATTDARGLADAAPRSDGASIEDAGSLFDAASVSDAASTPEAAPISDALETSDIRATSDAGGGAATATSRQLAIPIRNQWTNADGYCGETSIQAIALYYGTWVSQGLVRTLAGGEVLLGVNATVPLDDLGFTYTQWNSSAPDSQFDDFMVWLKTNLLAGYPPFFAAYLSDGNDPDYDHIMPASGIASTSASAFLATDVLTYSDNFGDVITRAATLLSATRQTCSYSSTEGGCIPTDVDYGIAVTGVADPSGVTFPVTLTIPGNSEPNVSENDAAATEVTGTVTVSGLAAGNSYALLRYDDYTNVPTSGSAAGFLASSYTYKTDFVAAGPTWALTDPKTIVSSGASIYRCVAQ
jgi:hypothetical protein